MPKTKTTKSVYLEEGSTTSSSEEEVREMYDLLKNFLKPDEPVPIYVTKEGKLNLYDRMIYYIYKM